MKNWWWVLLGAIFGLAGAGSIWLASSPPRGNPIQLLPPPTSAPIQVHVSGEVEIPGVYALPVDSRVEDAILAAGGFSKDANDLALNLAAILEDGSQISVAAKQPPPKPSTTKGVNQVDEEREGQLPPSNPGALVNINSASQDELETLPGIGPVTAQKIIEFRELNGPFIGIEDIQKVSGIGPATFEKLRDLITVNDIP
jgi:competence protein ComEA